MFPIDIHLTNTRTITSSAVSTRRDHFRLDVEQRDGTCVVTGGPPDVCEAAHILPHSKGDTYIETFSTHRCRESSGSNAIVQGIDDVCNGLFVAATIHRILILGRDVAFLKTPNFAMDTTDVDSNADRAQERFTNHLFNQSLASAGVAGRPGSAIQVPLDTSIWPPATLFDAIYASAVVHHFGTERKDALKRWGDVFYPGGAMKAARHCSNATIGVAGSMVDAILSAGTPMMFSVYIASRPWDPRKRGSIRKGVRTWLRQQSAMLWKRRFIHGGSRWHL
ncbi:hypothetical protein BC826DRAFT_586927 [Russula brevipes]|nr:hypothetical protein BC826DRAFT_586927 [Russula brevipes]